jgi:hypothetical protein
MLTHVKSYNSGPRDYTKQVAPQSHIYSGVWMSGLAPHFYWLRKRPQFCHVWYDLSVKESFGKAVNSFEFFFAFYRHSRLRNKKTKVSGEEIVVILPSSGHQVKPAQKRTPVRCIYYFTRSIYSPVRVSTFTLSPWLMNKGTFISTPFSVVAAFNAPDDVSPLTAGSE